VITTDLLVVGIDIQQASLVINYDLPTGHAKYIHRIGVSVCSGTKKVAISLVDAGDA